MKRPFATIPEALEEIRRGRLLIVVDGTRRENEGDFFLPADRVKPRHLLTMIQHGGGILCTAITRAQAARLDLPLMVESGRNTEKTGVNFTVSVNASHGTSSGVSAFDRAKTIRILADPAAKPSDLTRPGHVFGLVARPGGVLVREGHTEAAVDLARLAGSEPAGVLCEIVGTGGRMARRDELARLARKLGIRRVTIDDLVAYLRNQPLSPLPRPALVTKVATTTLPTVFGPFQLSVYRSHPDGREHTVLVKGKLRAPVITRLHSQCLTGDTLLSLRCDCRQQLHQSMKAIQAAGSGVILYLNQEGRGIGLTNKIRAYGLQDQGHDTVEANHRLGLPTDARDYEVAAHILRDLGVGRINLLTNNPDKEKQLTDFGITICARLPLECPSNPANAAYLATKKRRMGHQLVLA